MRVEQNAISKGF